MQNIRYTNTIAQADPSDLTDNLMAMRDGDEWTFAQGDRIANVVFAHGSWAVTVSGDPRIIVTPFVAMNRLRDYLIGYFSEEVPTE